MFIKQPLIVDISHWEPEINWSKWRPLISIAKATDGKSYKDPLFVKHTQGAVSVGAHPGGYHFFQPNDISSQVTNYLNVMASVGACNMGRAEWYWNVPPILDFEYTPAADLPPKNRPKNYSPSARGSALANQIKAWLDGVHASVGVRPMIYCRATGWAYTFDRFGNPPSWAKDCWAWVAGYPKDPDVHSTLPPAYVPKGFKNWAMWQYSESARFDAAPYDGVDVNLANPEWLAEVGIVGSAPMPTPEPVKRLLKAEADFTNSRVLLTYSDGSTELK